MHAKDPARPARGGDGGGAGSAPRVLLVSPDGALGSRLEQVAAEAWGAARLEHARDVDEVAAGTPADLAVLDLPARRPDAVVRRLAARLPGAGVIVLLRSATGDPAEVLEHGADAWLRFEELSAEALRTAAAMARHCRRRVGSLERRLRSLASAESALRTVLETTADGIVIVDEEGVVAFANPAAARMFGREPEGLIGADFGFPVVTGETTEIELRGNGAIVAELRVADTEWNGRPARVASLRDITARREAQQQTLRLLREQAARAAAEAGERRARFLGEASSVLAASLDYDAALGDLADLVTTHLADICLVDLIDDGHLRRVAAAAAPDQRAALARLGSPSEDPGPLRDSTTLRAGRARLLSEVDAPVRRALLGRDDLAAPAAAGVIVPLVARDTLVGALTLLSLSGEHAYYATDALVAEELGRRAAVAIDNGRLYQEAHLANRAKADFLAVMSHELRTPLNAVIGYADLLLLGISGAIGDPAREHVHRIRTSARHLLQLIEEILTFARVEAGREELALAATVLAELIHDVGVVIEPLARDKGLDFQVRIAPDAPTTFVTDAGKLRQVLLNLLSNAVKFTDHGAVRLDVAREPGALTLAVSDDGIGIDAALHDQIFEPFWQAESSRTRTNEGTGLGLSLARRFVGLLGGSILLRSRPGDGTTFTVRLPLENDSPGV